ncbi:hypothetical protein NKR19_g2984 [Coniochaeta hoffmannii]|uniref:Uncharacterized protein n=1 Tax=Coniochaeta hoffmannii TaxID=91930 RepID=A0AA38S9K4_9PEZI|nr:hypothetical protein NKR19_g2984 [Coniochaeta hoffmannii]
MSNEVPNISSDDVKPYCIWYPEVASEDTYRRLVKAYPDMVYTVRRACAVVGYNKLYHELNILPEVSIAKEAKDNAPAKSGAKAIFDHIKVNQSVMLFWTTTLGQQISIVPAVQLS